ncbi:MAG: S-layer homology domain-containing protein [Candidatus Gracilibacteria bacterium]
MAEKKLPKVKIEQLPFLGVLFLFAGFSLYGILSFNASLSEYVDSMYASVVRDGVLVTDASNGAPINPDLYTFEAYSGEEIFADVLGSYPNAVAIAYFKQQGWIAGYEDDTFRPDQLINRAELLTVLTSVVDVNFTGGVYENCFTDATNQWYAPYVCYAKASGWVDGYSDGSYKPGQAVNKAECLKITIDAVNSIVGVEITVPDAVSAKPYGDVEITAWYAKYAKIAKDGNVVTGSLFLPGTEMTRAEFVQMVYDTLVYGGVIK